MDDLVEVKSRGTNAHHGTQLPVSATAGPSSSSAISVTPFATAGPSSSSAISASPFATPGLSSSSAISATPFDSQSASIPSSSKRKQSSFDISSKSSISRKRNKSAPSIMMINDLKGAFQDLTHIIQQPPETPSQSSTSVRAQVAQKLYEKFNELGSEYLPPGDVDDILMLFYNDTDAAEFYLAIVDRQTPTFIRRWVQNRLESDHKGSGSSAGGALE